MATERVSSFLNSRDIHVMYQLTRDELLSVAGELGVTLGGDKKEELQIGLRTFLEKSNWFQESRVENNDGEGEKGDEQKGILKLGDLTGLSGTEKYELMKLQLQIEKDRIMAEKEKIMAKREVRIQMQREREQTEREKEEE